MRPIAWVAGAVGVVVVVSLARADELPVFGYDLFQNVPDLSAMPVGKDYPVGPGDEIIIRIGTVETPFVDTVVVVNSAGEIRVSGLSTLNLGNVKAGDLKDVIMANFAAHHEVFSELARADIRLGRLRGVVATVIGEVAHPGLYAFTGSNASLVQVLARANIKPSASLRRVVVDGQKVDLYRLLLYGEEVDMMLFHGARVYVPLRGVTVKVRGEVKRPAVYELLAGEKLSDLVGFAGGLSPYANPKGVQIVRHMPGLESALLDIKEGDPILVDGDEVNVPAVQNPKLQKLVTIRGNVRNPKTYALTQGMSLGSLFKEAKPYEDSWPTVQITRLDSTTLMRRKLEVSLAAALDGKDIPLQPMDEITVFSTHDVIGGDKTIEVRGHAKRPGVYPLAHNMSLRDALFLAGVTPEDRDFFVTINDTLAVMRRGEQGMETIPISLRQVFENNDMTPQSGDVVLLREDRKFKRAVTVLGEVRTPGMFSIPEEGLSLSRVLQLAGLTKDSFPEGIRVRNGQTIFVGNMDQTVLSPGDTVEVPAQSPLVFVRGAVKAPCAVKWVEGRKAEYYFRFAGVEGDADKAILIYANGWQERLKGFWSEKRIPPGSTLFVPGKEEKVKLTRSGQPILAPAEATKKQEEKRP